MEESELREFINKQSWIFAKTYANKAPHEYIVRGRINGTDGEFMSMVNYIQVGRGMIWISQIQAVFPLVTLLRKLKAFQSELKERLMLRLNVDVY